MPNRFRRTAARLCLGLSILLLVACRSELEVALDADFVTFSYQVPEVRYGPKRTEDDGRPSEFYALPTPSGTAVLTRLRYIVPGQPLGCCSELRLVNLDTSGAVVSEHILIKQTPGTVGFEVIPMGADDRTVSLAVTEATRRKINPSDTKETRVDQLFLMRLPRDGSPVARPPAIQLPLFSKLSNAFQRDDGLTVLTGPVAVEREDVTWTGIVGPDHVLRAQTTAKKGIKRRVHSHEFTEDGTLVLLEWANRWDEGGSSHALSHREIDLETSSFTETSLFGFPRSALTSSPLGKLSPGFTNVVALPEGGFVATMPGWYGGDFQKLRLVKVSDAGRIDWISELIPGKGQEAPLLTLGDTGEILVTGHSGDIQHLFRVGRDGAVIKTHPIRTIRIREFIPDPKGGFLAWVRGPIGADAEHMTLMRIEALPALDD